MKKTTILVMFVTIIAKVFGFLREAFIVKFFPDRAITDAFQVAYTIPNAILAVVAAALVTGLVPMIAKINEAEGEENVNKFTSNVLNIFLIICIALNVIVIIFPELFISIFANLENAGNALHYAVSFIRVISFSMITIAIVQLGMGYLNVKHNFLVPAGISIPSNIMILVAMYVSSKLNMPILLAYGQLIAMCTQALVIYLFMRKAGYQHKFHIDLKDEHLRVMIGLALPLVIGSLIGQFNDIVMKRQATEIFQKAGAYTYMNTASKLVGFVSGIFITSILSVTYPTVAKNVVKGNTIEVKRSINDAIVMLMVFVLPAIVGFITLARGVVTLAFGGLRVDEVAIVVPIFIFQAINLVAQSLRDLFTRIQYAYSDMKTTVKVGAMVSLGFVLGIAPAVALTSRFGHPLAGISLAFAVFSLLAVYPMYLGTKKHVGKIPLGIIKNDLIKIALSSIIMGVIILVLKGTVENTLGLKMGTLVLIAIGGLSYLVALIALRTQFVLKLIHSFLAKR